MFTITAFPATKGDSLLLTYGEENNLHYVLIDGGTSGTAKRFAPWVDALEHIELLVVTHVDDDHIDGILKWLAKPDTHQRVGEIWFNGYRHTQTTRLNLETYEQGDLLAHQIEQKAMVWNRTFTGNAVALENVRSARRRERGVAHAGNLASGQSNDQRRARITLPGGLKIDLLSPHMADIRAMRPDWNKEMSKDAPLDEIDAEEPIDFAEAFDEVIDVEELAREPFTKDASLPNRSSIAFTATYDGKTILLAGDAHHDILLESLMSQFPRGLPKLALVKLSHHGAQGTNPLELLERLDSDHFLISTSGGTFGHPHRQTIARILVAKQRPVTLHFNYRSRSNGVWAKPELQQTWGYSTAYPEAKDKGITIAL